MTAQRKTFAEVAGDFANKPPSEKGYDDVNGYSCLGFCYALYQKLGKKFPNAYGDLTLDNYNDKYVAGSPEAHAKLIEFAKTVGSEVPPHEKVAGDFVLVKDSAGHIFPGIYAGNGQLMCCFEYCGIKSFSYAKKAEVIIARRLK